MPSSTQKPSATSAIVFEPARDASAKSRDAQARLGNPQTPFRRCGGHPQTPKVWAKVEPYAPALYGDKRTSKMNIRDERQRLKSKIECQNEDENRRSKMNMEDGYEDCDEYVNTDADGR